MKILKLTSMASVMALSTVSNAAVVFTNYSQFDAQGVADYFSGSWGQYDVHGGPSYGGAVTSVNDYQGVSAGSASSAAQTQLNVTTASDGTALVGDTASISGSVYAGATATGYNYADHDAWAYSNSSVSMFFTITDNDYDFTFDSNSLYTSNDATISYGLYDYQSGTYLVDNIFSNTIETASFTETLGLGDYWLYLQGVSYGGYDMDSGYASGNFNASLTAIAPSAVPVPAAVWLFGSGLVGLAGIARRKSAHVFSG